MGNFPRLALVPALLVFVFLLGSTTPPFRSALTHSSISEIPLQTQAGISRLLGHDNNKYQFSKAQGGFAATNVAQTLTVKISAQGMTARRGLESWTVTLRRPGAVANPELPSAAHPVQTQPNRVEITRGALTEWFVNRPFGLEQGWTLNDSSLSQQGQVTLAFDTEGTLSQQVEQDALGMQLVDSKGNVVLTYGDLQASDATGSAQDMAGFVSR